jgi:hypothetical protein
MTGIYEQPCALNNKKPVCRLPHVDNRLVLKTSIDMQTYKGSVWNAVDKPTGARL